MSGKASARINTILFRSYMGAMLAVLLVVAIFAGAWELTTLNGNINSSIGQAGLSVAQNVDSQIEQMDTVSISALYSNLIKSSFETYSGYFARKTPSDSHSSVSNAKILHDLMFAIIGMSSDIRQVNLYNVDQGGFGTGMYNGYIASGLSALPWREQAVSANGRRYVTPPYQNEQLSFLNAPDKYFVSLCRIFFDQYNRMDGAIEVVQYYDTVFSAALNNDSEYAPAFYIYDPNGALLFPAEGGAGADYFNAYRGESAMLRTQAGKMEYVSYTLAPYSGFLTVAVVDGASFYAPIWQLLIVLLLLIGGAAALCSVTARRLTRRLSVPLMSMHAYLSEIDFEKLDWHKAYTETSGILEIDDLSKGVGLFQQKLKSSMDDVLLLQRQEAQSQMLALQSQTNPHFLYNSLSAIQAMSEEGLSGDISKMCAAIIGILRYISSSKESMARLEQELEHTDMYMTCLKYRYGENLRYTIDVGDEMLHVSVPKLCVQGLVENAVKNMTASVAPPWDIRIACTLLEERWTVTVSDNGGGFSNEACETLLEKMREIDETNLLPSLELEGMGLLNLYTRLRLIYKAGYIFEFGNRAQGGALVRIGGRADA